MRWTAIMVLLSSSACSLALKESPDASADLDADVDAPLPEERRIPDSATPLCVNSVGTIACGDPQDDKQDGTLVDPEPDLRPNGGVVFDAVTRLSWDIEPTPAATLVNADIHCSGKEGDWRVPSLLELGTILDCGAPNPLPPAFNLTPMAYWTSTQNAAYDLSSGELYLAQPENVLGVVCVSGQPLIPTFEPLDGKFREPLARLIWQVSTPADWPTALTQCDAGSRPPTIKELLTLFAAPQMFVQSNIIWSSSPRSDASIFVMNVNGLSLSRASQDQFFNTYCVQSY